MAGVTVASGVTDPGDVTIISGVSIFHTGVTLVDFNGGGPTPPTTVYFLSRTSSALDLQPSSLSIDSSGNISVFGLNGSSGLGGVNSGLLIKLTPSGGLSVSDTLNPANGNSYGVQDSSGNYYIAYTFASFYCCCGYIYYDDYSDLIKLDSSFNRIGELLNTVGYTYYPFKPPFLDNSGNIWTQVDFYGDSYYLSLIKYNSALTSITSYDYNVSFTYWINTLAAAVTSTNQLIAAGTYLDASGCGTSAYALIQSVPTATPSATPTWTLWDASGSIGDFNAIALDSSNNIYASLRYYNFPSNNWLGKINANGTLPLAWQRTYIGITRILSMATDSSDNVYAIGLTTSGTALAIIKVSSSGTLSFSRTLTAASGPIGSPTIKVNGDIMYISAVYYTAAATRDVLVFKAPTDGTLTQTVSVGGVNFTYALGGITSSTPSVTLSSRAGIPFTATALPTQVVTSTVNSLTASQAVTVL